MTPSAMTAAGRSAAPRPVQAPGVPGHRRTARPPQGPRGPRRVSGPARARSAPAPSAGLRPSLAARGLLVIRGLPEHTLLDRIVRGRAWIPLLGVLLVGIVAMQVEILKLGTGMGRWIERSSTLSTKNQALQASVAGLMDDQRIESLAAKMGMVMPDPTAVSFLSAQPGAARAVANIHAPDPSIFTAESASQAAAASSLASTASVTGATSGQAGGPVDTSSSASSPAVADAGTGTGSATATTASQTGATSDGSGASAGAGGTAGGAGGPVDSGGAGSSSGAGQPTGSGGAASIAPPSSQASGSSGG